MNTRKIISYIIIFVIFPILIYIGYVVLDNKNYKILGIILTIVACIPPFLVFEKGKPGIAKIVMLAVLIALSVGSRSLFVLTPGFKPVTAIIVISGLYFGKEVGFMVGAITAVISNMFFGQGPWTSFQMFAWGFTGLIVGIFSKYQIFKTWPFLIILGIMSGALFSVLMDVWTVLSYDNYFRLSRYLMVVASSFSFTIIYIISNIIFMILLNPILGKSINRIKSKYGII